MKNEYASARDFYTEGIKINCKDEELNAKLYNNRATQHFYLGEKVFHQGGGSSIFKGGGGA